MTIAKILARLVRDKRGLAAVEYALLCGLIVIVMITSLNTMANAIKMTWGTVKTETENAVQQAAAS